MLGLTIQRKYSAQGITDKYFPMPRTTLNDKWDVTILQFFFYYWGELHKTTRSSLLGHERFSPAGSQLEEVWVVYPATARSHPPHPARARQIERQADVRN